MDLSTLPAAFFDLQKNIIQIIINIPSWIYILLILYLGLKGIEKLSKAVLIIAVSIATIDAVLYIILYILNKLRHMLNSIYQIIVIYQDLLAIFFILLALTILPILIIYLYITTPKSSSSSSDSYGDKTYRDGGGPGW